MEENVRKKKKLSAEEKWQIYVETSAPGSPIGEILRKHGVHPAELAKIRQQVEKGAKEELGRNKYHKKPRFVDYEEVQKVKDELSAKEKALAQMSEEYLLLKKKTD